MKRIFQLSVLLVAILFFTADYSLANCFVAGGLPGGGNNVVCDDNAPNPSPTGVQVGVESTNNDDIIRVLQGSGINFGGNAIAAGLGADQITVDENAGTINGGNLSIGTEGSNNTMEINGGNFIAPNVALFFDVGDNNRAVVRNATIDVGNAGIFFNTGSNNSAEITNVTITTTNVGIFFNPGSNNVLEFHSGTINSTNAGIFMNPGNNTLHVNGGSIIASNSPIFTSSGEDSLLFRGGNIINPDPTDVAIETGPGDDNVRIERIESISGIIDGGADTDTLVFAQRVMGQGACPALQAEIPTLDPAGDSIVINGILYEWINFESIEDDLICPEDIPTLSEWGLIAMAGILGIVSFLVIRKRKLAA